jgi:hypothetical protein
MENDLWQVSAGREEGCGDWFGGEKNIQGIAVSAEAFFSRGERFLPRGNR